MLAVERRAGDDGDYRHSLKTALSWAIHRPIFIAEAEKIRAAFEANRHSVR